MAEARAHEDPLEPRPQEAAPERAVPEAASTPATTRRRAPWSARWRPALRALHRDFGYLVVGLTIIYAVSGLAVNHIADWDPNFVERETALVLPMPLPATDEAIAEDRKSVV